MWLVNYFPDYQLLQFFDLLTMATQPLIFSRLTVLPSVVWIIESFFTVLIDSFVYGSPTLSRPHDAFWLCDG